MQAIMRDVGDWESDAQAVAGYMEAALRNDALPNTVPLVYPAVQSPGQIAAHFGGPTYNKGGSLLRMIRAMLGESRFQTACQQFLAAHRFSNALATDLFGYFAAQWTDGPASEMHSILSTWGNQRGFPLVTVADESTASQRVWVLSQKQYLLDDGSRWPVWVQYSYKTAAGGEVVGAVWLNASNEYSARVSTPPDVQYVALNRGRASFYRVVYPSAAVYDEFRSAVTANGSMLAAADRIGLIADAYWTRVDGYQQSWSSTLNSTLRLLSVEAGYPVWTAGLTVLNDMWGRLRFAIRNDTTGLGTARSYIRMLASHAASVVQWEVDTHQRPDAHMHGMMQAAFGPLACKLHTPHCLQATASLYAQWRGNGSTQAALPSANMRALTLAYGLFDTPQAEQWAEQLFGMYLSPALSPIPQLATLYLEAAMVAARPHDVMNFTQYIVSQPAGTTGLRFTDTVLSVLTRLMQLSDIAQPTLLSMLVDSPTVFDSLVLPYDNNPTRQAFNQTVDGLIGNIQLAADLDTVKQHLLTQDRLDKMSAMGRARVNQAMAQAQRNIDWVVGNWPDIRAAMQAALNTQ